MGKYVMSVVMALLRCWLKNMLTVFDGLYCREKNKQVLGEGGVEYTRVPVGVQKRWKENSICTYLENVSVLVQFVLFCAKNDFA